MAGSGLRGALFALALSAGACGDAAPGGASPPAASRAGAPREVAVEVLDAGSGAPGTPGTVRGVVHFVGAPPLRPPLAVVRRTAGCLVEGETPLGGDVVVEDGRLADVVVALRDVPAGAAVPPPSPEPALLDQRACVFVPHVTALQAGRVLRVLNSDGCAHNVHVLARLNDAPNRTIGDGGAPLDLGFERAERVAIRCDLHPWMSAWVVVLEHPWGAVSGPDGAWVLSAVPPGEVALEAWHPTLGRLQSAPFRLGPGGEARVTFTYGGGP